MFSLVIPLDDNRLEQFKNTKRIYDEFSQKVEFILPTRSKSKVAKYLKANQLDNNVRLISYEVNMGFNVSKALNIGVRNAKYDSVIITSPEVMPMTPALDQLEELIGQNVICQVFDEDENGQIKDSLVCTTFRSESPAMYFLAMFNKKDIESINGWDEEFMKGYAYEDNDFGARWNRAGLAFIVRDDIKARHQYHPRSETIPNGLGTNFITFSENNSKGVVWIEKGLK